MKIQYVREKYPKHRRPSIIISNLKRFYYEMKEGDFVLIPATSGKSVAVGKITSDVVKIEGVKKIRRDGKIYNANNYSEWINNLVYSIYKQDDKYHYVINVKQKYGLTGKTVFGCFSDILALSDEFLKEENIDANTDSVEIKIAISTPGWLTFICENGEAIATILLLIIFIVGGEIKLERKDTKFEIHTSGLLKKVNEFLDSEKNRKVKDTIIQKIKSLEIENPTDIIDLINSINKKNKIEDKTI
jgi:hypothetical protein